MTEPRPDGTPMPVVCEDLSVALLTGGGDKHYALDLARSLMARGVSQDFIGSDDLDVPELREAPQVRFLNLRGDQRPEVGLHRKVFRVVRYYLRLVRYAATARPKVFHILWNNKWQWFDRSLLMAYYKLLGKRVVLTAHNVNAGRRDSNDTVLNRLTLKCQYRLADRIFVHTDKMKAELRSEFGVPLRRICVIPYGMNQTVPETGLTGEDARARLGLQPGQKVVLFFGNIAPYKGLEWLIEAMDTFVSGRTDYRLVIAGRPKGPASYFEGIQRRLDQSGLGPVTIQKIEYIPDEDIEMYFKAADLLALPYRHIYQSGVLFLAYCFGLPVVASDVGSLREDILEGRTGLLCKPDDTADLARAIQTYFDSDLYRNLDLRRAEIRAFAIEHHSWEKVATLTEAVYRDALARPRTPGGD